MPVHSEETQAANMKEAEECPETVSLLTFFPFNIFNCLHFFSEMKLLSALYPNYDLSLLSKFPFDSHHPFSVPRKFLESKPGSARLKMARNRLSSKLAQLRMAPIEDQRYMQNIMNDDGYLPQTTYISGSSEI